MDRAQVHPAALCLHPATMATTSKLFPSVSLHPAPFQPIIRRPLLLRATSDPTPTPTDTTDNDAAPKPQLDIRYRSRSKRAMQRQQQERSEAAPPPKKKTWEEMTLPEKAMEVYVGEKGLLFWLNKFAYASIFIVIGGWILFRFVGPALNLYQLDAPPLAPDAIFK